MNVPAKSPSQKANADLSIEKYLNLSPEEYVTKRAAERINSYADAAKSQSRWYYGTSTAAIIGSAIVPVLVNLGKQLTNVGIDPVLATTIISLIVTILVSAEKLFRFREHWRSYETVAAALRYEQLLFQTRAGKIYGKTGATEEQLFPQFVKRFEGLILEEKNMRIAMETDLPTTSE